MLAFSPKVVVYVYTILVAARSAVFNIPWKLTETYNLVLGVLTLPKDNMGNK